MKSDEVKISSRVIRKGGQLIVQTIEMKFIRNKVQNKKVKERERKGK